MHKKRTFGFTLIELLVVVAIISLLSSVVLASLNSARKKARDAQRLSDLHQMRVALDMYFSVNGKYPSFPGVTWVSSADANQTNWLSLQAALSPYIKKLPTDPKNNAANPWVAGNYSYSYGWYVGLGVCPAPYAAIGDCTGQVYDLVGQLEDTGNSNRCTTKQWSIHTFSKGTSWCGAYSGQMVADH